ncbi:hypothetical protein CVD28_11485 [Bacillus sp. M6-12]|uniref:hypothetical protein n=1 Tax=Bacillus sp. M6-12 TaxID=2054166 RepID=UPI000C771061|nr:hypothetical protein [Bacillus sp. M6-12]PLS17608.1 hypothetical protein CVD28_11485 [Bacillus sp. M6-12]
MEQTKTYKVRLVISGDINLDALTKSLIEEEYGRQMSNQEAAESLFFAFVNPKITSVDPSEIQGGWDNVCDFAGKIGKMSVEEY